MYQQFLGKLELERKDFMESYEQNPSRYSRSTLNILDYIEEDKRRFSKNMSMGLNNKKLIYFASINFNDERYRATTNKNIDFWIFILYLPPTLIPQSNEDLPKGKDDREEMVW